VEKSKVVLAQARRMPSRPGVYLMKDAGGSILYIGKAANLRQRVRSYFGNTGKLEQKVQRMVARAANIDFFITSSEEEALVLELNLIKRFHPYYNVRLKDDKSFPYLKIDLNEDWPMVQITRRLENDGSRYFGPFAKASSIRRALKAIKDIFPFRPCSKNLSKSVSRPCLEYDLHNCSGPCIGATTRKEYLEIMRQLILFLEGRQEVVVRQLEGKMKQAADALDYEKAASLRDQIEAVREVIRWQQMATTVRGDQDVIAFAHDKDQAYAQVFFIRGGKLISRESFTLQGTRYEEVGQIMTSFVKHFYNSTTYIPSLILLQHPVTEKATIERWLQGKRGGRVQIQVPLRGNKKRLVDTVAENAVQSMEQPFASRLAAPATIEDALDDVKRELDLPRLPERMEGYDISSIKGKAAVGSMVVFERGRPQPAHYRRFRIKTVPTADDYAMLREVIQRRFRHREGKEDSSNWSILPDLVLVDGGRGQLNAVLEAMLAIGADPVPIASLAKENEELFTQQKRAAIKLPRSSPGLQLLQRLRDEAHRFALGYHHRLRQKQTFGSALDDVPGIGTKRRRHLLRQFGSVEAIREAPIPELAAIRGMSRSLAQKIKECL
jgi:excinuclease ABC subunit C